MCVDAPRTARQAAHVGSCRRRVETDLRSIEKGGSSREANGGGTEQKTEGRRGRSQTVRMDEDSENAPKEVSSGSAGRETPRTIWKTLSERTGFRLLQKGRKKGGKRRGGCATEENRELLKEKRARG